MKVERKISEPGSTRTSGVMLGGSVFQRSTINSQPCGRSPHLQLVVVGDREGGGFLVFGDAALEEILLLLDVHHLSEPGQRVLDSARERSKADALEAPVSD